MMRAAKYIVSAVVVCVAGSTLISAVLPFPVSAVCSFIWGVSIGNTWMSQFKKHA